MQDPSVQQQMLESGGALKLDTTQQLTENISMLAVDEDIKILQAKLSTTTSTTESSRIIRQLLEHVGTNCSRNDADPYGDGDQSLITSSDKDAQILRDLFSVGGDFLLWLRLGPFVLPPFVMMCVSGNSLAVEQELKVAQTWDNRQRLLELRTTSMRFPALLMTLAAAKSMINPPLLPFMPMKHTEVMRILLRYGARPNAKDVTGKTGKMIMISLVVGLVEKTPLLMPAPTVDGLPFCLLQLVIMVLDPMPIKFLWNWQTCA